MKNNKKVKKINVLPGSFGAYYYNKNLAKKTQENIKKIVEREKNKKPDQEKKYLNINDYLKTLIKND